MSLETGLYAGKVGAMMASLALSMGLLCTVTGAPSAVQTPAGLVMMETDTFALGIADDGRAVSFVDRSTGKDYSANTTAVPFASIKIGTELFPVTAATKVDNTLLLTFGEKAKAALRVTPERRRLVLEVVSLEGDGVEELTFAQVPLTLKEDLSEPFGVSPLAMNLQTNCAQFPGVRSGLTGFTAYRRFGIIGARGAIVAAPMDELRDALKDAVKSSPDLPHSPLGGPWALDAKINMDSYLIDSGGTLTEANVGAWIDTAHRIGAKQIDLHGGHSFRWGDYEVNPELYPRGRASLKAVVDAMHAGGLAVGLHSYAFFIDKRTPWVTPVPDKGLSKDATFTLAGDLGVADAAVIVEETTESMSTVTGFHVRNSVTLQIDDELITYTGVDKQAPFAFTGCVRGAYGTKAAAHAKGAPVHHLRECFGLFVPDGDSALFTEVAQRTADVYNACGFDMLYLDALDGSDVPSGWQYAWHYAAKFAFELAERLDKPAVMEMSTFTHHLWCVRSRMEAWDCPSRDVKSFVDAHLLRNRQWQNAFLPTHLGWWGIFEGGSLHPERTTTDDMEYVCAKALGTDSSLSYLVGFTPESLARGNTQRLADISKRYEELRRTGTVPESIKERLAKPGAEFTLETSAEGKAVFRPVAYPEGKVAVSDAPATVEIVNPFGAQPLRMRIEALTSPEPYDSAASQVLTDFAGAEEFGKRETQAGVEAKLEPSTEGDWKAVLSAKNTDVEPTRAWASFQKEFAPPVDLVEKGLGLWVEGDGQGEVINVQVRSPLHLTGGFADRYIKVDFTGRKYFALVEPESDELSHYEWAHTLRRGDWEKEVSRLATFAYPMYHIWADYRQFGSMTVAINNLPQGKPVQVKLGAIKALPLHKVTLKDPTVTIGGKTLTFPVELESGSYLEFLGMDDCKVYDARGECIGTVTPVGEVPTVVAGANACSIGMTPRPEGATRARVVVISRGEPLRP